MSKVRVDIYKTEIVVFVCGYALKERSIPAAYHVAEALGEDSIDTVDYRYGRPVREKIQL
jgi:hypothetical protein